jgi:hypothetical protein
MMTRRALMTAMILPAVVRRMTAQAKTTIVRLTIEGMT